MRNDADRAALSYWNNFSGAWRIPPPLAPAAEDISWFEQSAGLLGRRQDSGPGALLLGVTPAIAGMRWPQGTSLVAVDWAWGMLRNVWVEPRTLAWAARIDADWREMPLAAASRDIAVGDGCYTALGSFENAARLNAQVRRALREGGLYCLRCFVRPDRPERVEDLFGELFEGRVPNLDFFRWRLAMALQGTSRSGRPFRDTWQIWNARVRDPAALATRHGWPESALKNFERWKELEVRYYFASPAEVQLLAAPCFEFVSCDIPTYEWGERFRRAAMRAR